MPPRPELGVPAARPTAARAGNLGWTGAVVAAVLLSLTNPLTWAAPHLPLWSPAAGLGLVVIAWFGWRDAAVPLAGAALLLFAGRGLLGTPGAEGRAAWLAWVAAEATLAAAAPALAWWTYHSLAGGQRRLADPRSATQFVLVPTAALGAVALARLLAAWLVGPAGLLDRGAGLLFAGYWLELALGTLVVAPPLLVLCTPRLARAGLLAPEAAGPSLAADGSAGPRTGDWLEIAGLALGASILCLLLGRLHGRSELLGWQLWGMQMLLIVWASIRQGLPGGVVVAAVAALAELLDRQLWPPAGEGPLLQPLLQAHLAA